MAKDLPSRPKRDPEAPVTKVSATDRVKAKTDKLDPKFEAARRRLEREAERRARAEAARQAKLAEEASADRGDRPDGPPEQDPPKKGFSFNQTARRPGDGERDRKDAS